MDKPALRREVEPPTLQHYQQVFLSLVLTVGFVGAGACVGVLAALDVIRALVRMLVQLP